MSKRWTVLFLLFTLTASVAAEDFAYTTSEGTVTIIGYTGPDGDVVIPERIDGLPVVSIADRALSYRVGLTSVTIPKSVTRIGDHAFSPCTGLTTITVDVLNTAYSTVDGVLFNKSTNTLIQCPGGKAGIYTIPNSVATIDGWAFWSCTSLTRVTMSDSVTTIGPSAFYQCTKLASITIGNKVTSLAGGAFSFCTSLATFTIPDSVTSIGDETFCACTNLTSVTIGNGVARIADETFSDCTRLTSVLVPDSVTNIGYAAFARCVSLTNAIIGSSVNSIGEGAFCVCKSLTGISIPDRVTSIGNFTFQGCSNLTLVCFQGNAPGVGSGIFLAADNVTVYYLPGTTGWGATLDGRPIALWHLPHPLILHLPPSFGVQTNAFGFIISWATNASVAVEACTNLANPIWSPIATNTLTEGWSYFGDPELTSHPARFYRLRSP